MREIKFRQPIFLKGMFISWHYWGFTGEGTFTGVELSVSNHEQALKRSQQFTNLKDKSGKEIYEGDFIRAISEYEQNIGVVIQSFGGEWQIEFKACNHPLYKPTGNKDKDNEKYHTALWGWRDGQYNVVGNIYENPNLLEAQNGQK